MARLKIGYVGGGGTRAVGTNASFIHQGANFSGSEIVLIDKDLSRLPLVQKNREPPVVSPWPPAG